MIFVELKYVNHLNESLIFGSKSGVFIEEHSLRNFLWNFQVNFQKITGFYKEISERSLSVKIYKPSLEASNNLRNDFFELFEKDVLSEKKGKFWIGDYYLECYVVGSSDFKPILRDDFIQKNLTIVTDTPVWIKEAPYHFYRQEQVEGESFYPYGYSYGYSNNQTTQRILNENFTSSNFKLIIYGPVIDPTVFINGHPYTVHTEVGENERLTISSLDKTVMKTKVNGEQMNEFNMRNKTYSVFKQIAPGQNSVSFDGSFDFEIVLFEERSEPKWI